MQAHFNLHIRRWLILLTIIIGTASIVLEDPPMRPVLCSEGIDISGGNTWPDKFSRADPCQRRGGVGLLMQGAAAGPFSQFDN